MIDHEYEKALILGKMGKTEFSNELALLDFLEKFNLDESSFLRILKDMGIRELF